MTRNFAVVAVVLASLSPFAGAASELKPMQGGTFVLGDQSASIYYTVSGDSFEVVTTIGPADGSGGPVRFVGFLQPGEKQIVSAGTYGTTTPPPGAGADPRRRRALDHADAREGCESSSAGPRRAGRTDAHRERAGRPRPTVPSARACR